MKIRHKILITVILLCSCHTPQIFGQGVLFNFSYDKSTYSWEDSLWLDNNLNKNFSLLLNNHSTATLIKKSLFIDSGDRWQKNADTKFALTYGRKNRFSWGITAYNNYNRLESRRVTRNQIGLHQNLKLSGTLNLASLVSYSETTRSLDSQESKEQGLLQKLDLTYVGNLLNWGSLGISYNQELNLLKRTPEKLFGLNLGFVNRSTKRQVQINYTGNYQKNKFFSNLTSFESVTTQDKYEHEGDLQIKLKLLDDLDIDLISNYSYRRFEYREEESDGYSSVLGRDNLTAAFYYKLGASYPLFGISRLNAEYHYRDSDEEFGDLFSGQNIKLGELRLSYFLAISPDDSVSASGTFSVTTYTGKDPSNLFSDRDRVFKLVQLGYQRGFSDYFQMRLRGSYQYNHNIYISGQLSANNNHNELYLIQPEVIWRPHKSLEISQSWIMHANYIYYDYEKYEDSDRNTIYRKVDYLTSINYAFSPTLDILFTYRYRYEDYGQLVYRDQWAQRISWERKGHLPAIELRWRPADGLNINPGFSYERKHSFDHLAGENEGETILQEKELFKRKKIYINVNYRPGPKSDIQFSYTRREQKSVLFSDEDSDIITLNIRRYF